MAMPTWKTYLYQLQLKAPRPKRVACQRDLPNRPPQYGKEFHGFISREETDSLLQEGDGCYLVRESQRAPGAYTLAIRFDKQTKNYKLYHDGKHYVGEKRFDTVHDLVADGLITFYLESRAADYIAALSSQSNYAESPYMVYSGKKKRRNAKTKDSSLPSDRTDGTNGTNYIVQPDQITEEENVEELLNVQDFEKTHVFKVHNFKGLHWCDFCANFMWGIIAQGVKCQDCGFQAHKKCSEQVPNDCMPDMKYIKRIFGADLTTLVKAQNTLIPIVVEKCVKEIESRGIEIEGLYRVAGFHDDVEAIRIAFDKDGESVDISETRYEDINTITSVLKLYFRSLPIPLISFDAYPRIMEAVKLDSISDEERKSLIKEGFSLLPPAHYQTLKYLLSHLARVIEKRHSNMMNPENLAIVFAPTLMRCPELDPMASLMAAKFEHKAMDIILEHQKELLKL
ncbi:N-chimaerin-like isoform X2 [Liolophura sinensis]